MIRIQRVVTSLTLLLIPMCASAQELEPGAYWPLPRGLNIVTAIDSLNVGDVAFEPSAPIDEASATINTTAIAFARAFRLFGRSANASVMVPIVAGHLEGLYLGEAAEVDRFGLGDPKVKLAVNLYGAPSMTPKDIATYRMRTIVGVSIAVLSPLGQYGLRKTHQHRQQPGGVQARAWRSADVRPLGHRGDGRRLAVHRQHGVPRRTHARASAATSRRSPSATTTAGFAGRL